jgi:hypothetical protein
LEVKLPIPFSGVAVDVNSPILVVLAKAKVVVKSGRPKVDISSLFREATGFECKFNLDVEGDIPFSSYYVIVSKLLVERAIEKCAIPINEDEKFETLRLIDDALFDSRLIRALRTAQRLNVNLLYRDDEDPVPVDFAEIHVRKIASYPIEVKGEVENSVVHTIGVIPVLFSQGIKKELVEQENGIWHSLYSIRVPYINNWKVIWDLNWATIIEFSS